jgi:nicotinate-nucleotide pyrophosphorylase (carboxylating)
MTRATSAGLPPLPPRSRWEPLLEAAIAEDLGAGDVTSQITFDPSDRAAARIEARQDLVICGLPLAEAVFQRIDPTLRVELALAEGELATPYEPLLHVSGPVLSLLAGERTALNFLGRLCGVASHTRRYVDAIAGTRARIVDTRKTLPGWRVLDKYAVAVGGGTNHRMGLYDGILLKDNHAAAAGGLDPAVKRALAKAPSGLRVQVEVQSEQEALVATRAGADFLLLDNLSPAVTARIVEQLGEVALLESSGGITLDNVRAYAETGVHRISIGALTHSAPNADISLEIETAGAAR